MHCRWCETGWTAFVLGISRAITEILDCVLCGARGPNGRGAALGFSMGIV